MEKEEILQRSRQENKNGDERERSVRQKKSAVAASVGWVACMFFAVMERMVFDRSGYGFWCVLIAIRAAENISEYRESRERVDLMWAVLKVLMLGLFLAMYLYEGFGN